VKYHHSLQAPKLQSLGAFIGWGLIAGACAARIPPNLDEKSQIKARFKSFLTPIDQQNSRSYTQNPIRRPLLKGFIA
jgi:hypothetical protein